MTGEVIVKNLSKAYVKKRGLITRSCNELSSSNLALDSISFTIKKGESFGIIGINGAGKSTLLKILSGVSIPTSGSVFTNGRVVSLLELGIGFHPEFTGRQNIYLISHLLGFKKNEIDSVIENCISFSELNDNIDDNLRTYSTGMQMRLAFSIATSIRPDILIIDEALSVGDAYFQQKSIDRIALFKKNGTTIIIVSHDLQAILSLCENVILLDNGKILHKGKPDTVIDFYNAFISQKNKKITQILQSDNKYLTTSGTGEASISKLFFSNQNGDIINNLFVGEYVTLNVFVNIHSIISKISLGFIIKDRVGTIVYGTNSENLGVEINLKEFKSEIKFEFCFPANFGPGFYSISLALSNSDRSIDFNYEWTDRLLTFEILNQLNNKSIGLAWIPVECKVKIN